MYKIFGKSECPACQAAKNLVLSKGLPLQFVDVAIQENKDHLLAMLPGAKIVPQIFVNDRYLGSLEDLKNYLFAAESTPVVSEGTGIKIQLNG